jgi:hypothetical protein
LTSTADREEEVEMTGTMVEWKLIRLVVVATFALVACSGPEETPQAEKAATTEASQASESAAEEVAREFLEAYGAFDAEKAMTYVADGADITGLVAEQVPGDADGLSLMLSFLEAQGYEQTVASCDAAPFGSDIGVVCAFDFHAIRSDEIGRGPFTGSTFTFTVREGKIVRGSLNWNVDKFSPQVWEPFADWVSETYPEDFHVMYTGSGSGFRLSEESIRLWEKRSREYVKEVRRS